ncbi:HAD domain-containing protein [Mucilaginibacter sabulilitoris]|uniref:HAD domain-containing protein n=1 Tax=Mucilaginibacter sabulilitoris TaxID=1173583 RepID=A0ABZ0THG3_9SPHI|nr:HAD domain-containing protein [Mucilaginibacter sabulilitoris]WPU92636.1 HAD domain-containing protein [Mucilaginibacter sabulilitoris]
MVILLDIDGVLVTEPSWKKVEIGSDGFMLFNKQSAENLAFILSETNASVILTTTHRINFGLEKWIEIFTLRGINIRTISKLNDKKALADMSDRATEIKEWIGKNGNEENYVIVDDDTSINNLPSSIKKRWVVIKPSIGIDEEAKHQILDILLNK